VQALLEQVVFEGQYDLRSTGIPACVLVFRKINTDNNVCATTGNTLL
jgi:hypothetical protein